MDDKDKHSRISLIQWFINTVVIGLLTFFFTWVLDERKQGVEEIKVYNTYVELVTQVDGLAERRLLAEFFSNVTVSSKLKEGWQDYYEVLDRQYKNEIAKQDSIITEIDTSTILGQERLENAIYVKNKIQNTGLTSPIVQKADISNYEVALQKELEGFQYLLNQNLDDAIIAFSKAEKSYNSFHQVYEIELFLKQIKKSGATKDDEFWNFIYRELLRKYSWKMPVEIKSELQKLTKN